MDIKTSTGKRLFGVYDKLYSCFGPQYWWPAAGPFEVIVGAILTQSAAWTNVEKGIAALKQQCVLSPSGIRDLPFAELAALVHPCGYYQAKAKKLKCFADFLGANCYDDLSIFFFAGKPGCSGKRCSAYTASERRPPTQFYSMQPTNPYL